MAQFFSDDSCSLKEQLRILGNDDLLDFWEESQLLGKYLCPLPDTDQPSNVYESAILSELQLRHSAGEI